MPTKLIGLVESVAFWSGVAIVALAFTEGLLQLAGISMTSHTYSAGRLLEFATMVFVFVAVINLREIRGALSKGV